MARRPILGIFQNANTAADAGDALRGAGISNDELDFLTDCPYPEGAFGERHERHNLYLFPFIGALLGLTSGILLTSMTQVAYPLVTGGKPILSLPPMAVISYEGTMLGAILFTVLGVIFESRLPNLKKGLYDTRITEGYIGVLVNTEETEHDRVQLMLNQTGAVDVKRQ
jgi:molybdopterin-containing oxidoreductase family membrane subunit